MTASRARSFLLGAVALILELGGHDETLHQRSLIKVRSISTVAG